MFFQLMVTEENADLGEVAKIAITSHSAQLIIDHIILEFKLVRHHEQGHANLLSNRVWHWLSIDSNSHMIKFGTGYALNVNTIYQITLDQKTWKNISHVNAIKYIDLCDAPSVDLKPVTNDIPIYLIDRDQLTWEILDTYSKVVPSSISPVLSYLFDSISGNNISLSQMDIQAITYSLFSPGKLLFNVLKTKMQSQEGNDPTSICIRCAIGADEFERTGIPYYIVNIWPPTHRTPIMEYRDTFGVNKVLHGDLTLQIYNPLIEDPNAPIYSYDLMAGDVTWFSPDIYQTHRYVNSNSVTCTLQYIKADGGEAERYRCYDDDNHVKVVVPIADMRFRDLLLFVREEYQNELTKGTEDTEAIIADHKQFLEKLLAQTEGSHVHVTSNNMEENVPFNEKSELRQEEVNTINESMIVPEEKREEKGENKGEKKEYFLINEKDVPSTSSILLPPETSEIAVPIISDSSPFHLLTDSSEIEVPLKSLSLLLGDINEEAKTETVELTDFS